MPSPSIPVIRRIESVDVLRGIVMIIMALDHVRDFIHIGAFTDDPLNLATTTPVLYFTRWITHFCAPVFVFLSGVSIYLQSFRKTKKELSVFIIKRGLWLIAVDLFIMSLVISFNPNYNYFFLQVIWTIGISMVLLGLFIHLPFKLILALGLVIVFGHNLLDRLERAEGFDPGFAWDLLHTGNFALYPLWGNHTLVIIYPFVAWTGLMMLGYVMGSWYSPDYPAEKRKKMLTRFGLAAIFLFIVLRYLNIYGNPFPWSPQKNLFYTLLSFLNTHKYPPSLLFICMTIGPSLLMLAWLESLRNGFTRTVQVFGRVALFYYIAHFFLAHLVSAVLFLARGHSLAEADDQIRNFPFYFLVPGEGLSLPWVYLVWLGIVLFLYPLCKWYNDYKSVHKEKWWLSYL
ncbi:MAG TPA: heparan-alpha-glucosaminide N-acetyltransferase domain-containing protein [Saprospiraceae bacterium]|nr:heparan-alpha-glucosaminide N-acetyltransferase domain-containing protein [Saprospiraceae bacterium]HNT19545.1 heparan-alpha-glucosaminide N-acetyltransferase domain-containing protein [Saprospiraceae bacterium]